MVYCPVKLLTKSAFFFCFCFKYFGALYLFLMPYFCCYYFTFSVCFRPCMNSHRNVSSSIISCLSILKYTVHELLCFSVFSLRTLKILVSYDVCLPFLCHCFCVFVEFPYCLRCIIIVKFIFDCFHFY